MHSQTERNSARGGPEAGAATTAKAWLGSGNRAAGKVILKVTLYVLVHSVASDSATPWTAAHQASLSFTNSQSLLNLMSIDLVMSSNQLILCHPLVLLLSIFPSIRVFSNESVLPIGGQSIGTSASVLAMYIQD